MELARQVPVFDINFLKDFTSDMAVACPFLGRHQTETWEDGAEVRVFDKVHVGQPNYQTGWNRRRGQDCNSTCPTRTWVGWGTTRDEYGMDNRNIYSKLMNLDQLRMIPNLKPQIAEIYRNLRKIPLGFSNDYVRVRMLSQNDTLQVCGSAYQSIALETNTNTDPFEAPTGNIDVNANTINTGGVLPTSDLSWTYLENFGQVLGLNNYDSESGMPSGMRSLITHSRTFQRLVGLNPEIRSMIRLADFKSASPLYMPGKGINAEAFGRYSPTFDENQLRYQLAGDGVTLERVLPYQNTAATTGLKPIINPAWLNARYAISYIIHPKATTVLTPKPKKIHELIPTINTAFWGQWQYIGGSDVKLFNYVEPDGTEITVENNNGFYFFWLSYLEMGFKYEQRQLLVPILHLIDGAGKASTVDVPICGTAPQYVVQNPSDNPAVCNPLNSPVTPA